MSISQDTRDTAVRLYADDGLTFDAVSKQLGVAAESVRTWVRAAGIKSRSRTAHRNIALAGGRWVTRNGVKRWEPQS